jgi:hypothetical protein
MRSQPVEALEVLEDDLRHARTFYDSWRMDGSSYFQKQFNEAVSWIEWNPELFPKKYRFFRRTIIRNTYYGIFFVIEPEVTTLVAVFDLRQKPSTIRKMLKSRR